MVYRIFVEKKPGFNVEAGALLHELTQIFGLTALSELRVLNRYDVEGLDSAFLREAIRTVFSETQVDITYDALPVDDSYDYALAVQYLPGQFDQRADSCEQCLQVLTCSERPRVRTAKIYLFKCSGGPALTPGDIQAIKRHLINPVESMEASFELPDTLAIDYPAAGSVPVLEGFVSFGEADLERCRSGYGLAMDLDDLAFLRDYFKREGRDPTLTELRVIDTYWSDHCRHTTFLTHLTDIRIDDDRVRHSYERFLRCRDMLGRGDRPVTLMELATIGARVLEREGKLTALDKSEEINACSVRIKVDEDGAERDWLLLFKNETHNHPTEIEPFGGAATCIGGAIRDPLSGRSYVYQAMRVTGSGDPTVPVAETLPGKLPQRSITTKAARGYSSYGNQVGLATGLVREIYHPGFIAKRMEVGAVIGAARVSDVVRRVPEPGDVVILLGGRTGRDGCGGATGSSKPHDADSLAECGAEVQKGNAPEERKIQRLFRNPEITQLIKRCNDFGAGGVAVAVGELADGLAIDLDAVTKKYSGLDGTELAISESQERMAVVVSTSDIDTFIALAAGENLEAAVIAEVTAEPRLVMNWNGQRIVDISREFLNTNGTAKSAAVVVENPGLENRGQSPNFHSTNFTNLTGLVADLNVCSQRGLIEQFDSTIGAGTVLMPLGGVYQATPSQVMAAKIPVKGADTETCSLMSFAYYPEVSQTDPYIGAYLAVASSVIKVVAAGGSLSRCWLSFQEYFERLGNDPARWGKPLSALLGALDAQLDLGVAAIGGKDSMSGSFEELDVPPTLISFAVSTARAGDVVSGEFKKPGSDVVLLLPQYDEDGNMLPDSLKALCHEVEWLISDGKVLASYIVETGGIDEAVFKMCIGNRIGFEFEDKFRGLQLGSVILELAGGCDITIPGAINLGKTRSEFTITVGGDSIDCLELLHIYENRLETVFPTHVEIPHSTEEFSIFNFQFSINHSPPTSAAQIILKKPRVLIPVFPGTNCEYDTARAFEKGGAEPEILVVKNLSQSDIEWSVRALSDAINKAQIVALPGGFSGGDEPDGSGKFIVSFFRNPRIKEAVHRLLKDRDGLMCGICNGFQALIKLGLVPYGEIIDTDENSPTLTYNSIGRHQSMLVRTRIASTKSPWLAGFNVGDIHTVAISHGEGRFAAHPSLIEELAKNGQIAAQYVDFQGQPSMDTRFNPNGSAYAIEAITSPDGRVLGKMGHSERAGKGLYKNVPGNYDQDIFSAAVRYYRV